MENERILTIQFKITRLQVFAVLTAFFICFHPKLLGSETLTLTTYYPSPYGGYARLLTTNKTLLARDGGAVGIGDVNDLLSTDTKLTVYGRVGIGTDVPSQMLDVDGIAKINEVMIGQHHEAGISSSLNKKNLHLDATAGTSGAVYINWYNGAGGDSLVVGSGSGKPVMRVNSNGNVTISGTGAFSGRLLGICRAQAYSHLALGGTQCKFGERVLAYYGNGIPQVTGFLPSDGTMSGAGKYISLGHDWSGTMLCCKID